MNQESSQGFVCEIDDRDEMRCELIDDGNGAMELAIISVSRGKDTGGITIGRDQIQNLIDFLERSKEVVRA